MNLFIVRLNRAFLIGLTLAAGGEGIVLAAAGANGLTPGDRMIAAYFKAETAKLASSCLANIHTLADWQARRPELRREAAEMLGLYPMPKRTPLHPVITGKIERDDFTVEKLYFQSSPHLYVTANLYLPKPLSGPAPTVLYLCGHSPVIIKGISYGNKVAYQQHGIWFARNGYVCLVIDTIQWGEILGHHWGTYSEGKWWWNSRGYTPAGIETWDALRALDYLETLPEVDTNRIGVTGRSGGGAYSWFLAAVDDRVKVIAPVAGITDLQNYCVDGTVDGHCDCMFLVNTYRWDYPMLAALCAPRPLLLGNSDADALFPLDGVLHTRNLVERIYDLYGASTNFGLVITPGPHKDTQELQLPVFRWFNIHLKHEDPIIAMAAVKMFTPQELKVFKKIPSDEINTHISDSFVPAAPTPEIPASAEAWEHRQAVWKQKLREKCFAGWPAHLGRPGVKRIFSETANGIRYEEYEIQSQEEIALPLYIMRRAGDGNPGAAFLRVADASFTNSALDSVAGQRLTIQKIKSAFGNSEPVGRLVREIEDKNVVQAIFFPRGMGPTRWSGGTKRETQIRRRFMLLGQTLAGMRVWDIRRAVEALHSLKELSGTDICVEASGKMGINALYAALFEPEISALDLSHAPSTHMEGPDYLNVLKILDIPETAAMVAQHCRLRLQSDERGNWSFLRAMAASPAASLKLELVFDCFTRGAK